MTRGIFVALLLVSCLYVTYGWSPNIKHNLILGRKKPNDTVLYRRTVYKSNWNPLANIGIDVSFPVNKRHDRNPLITQIDSIDLDGYNKGAFVSILKGGIGRRYVTVRFTSQKGRGINFKLTIYGHN